MEPLAKKSKCDQSAESEKLKLLDLNDHCIYLILKERLPEDLCLISLTCKKLENMAFDCFRMYHRSESLTISCYRHLTLNGNLNYSKRFRKLIPNIDIRCAKSKANQETIENLYRFVKLNCSAELESIWLEGSEILDENLIEIIKDQLKSVKILKINRFYVENKLYNNLLKYCKNIERITIYEVVTPKLSVQENIGFEWLQHEYPKLKSLQLQTHIYFLLFDRISRICFCRLLTEFFHKNPSIEDFETSDPLIRELVIDNLKNIKRLSVLPTELDFQSPLSDKFVYYYRNNSCTEMFELKFHLNDRDNFLLFREQIEMLNSIYPIHRIKLKFVDGVRFENLMQLLFLNDIKHLKYLQFDFGIKSNPNDEFWKKFSENCLYLEELRIFIGYGCRASKEYIKQFVCNSPKLKMLILSNVESLDENDLSAWNKVRKKLNGTVHVTILDARHGSYGLSRMSPMSQCTVTFKRVHEDVFRYYDIESAWNEL